MLLNFSLWIVLWCTDPRTSNRNFTMYYNYQPLTTTSSLNYHLIQTDHHIL